MTSRAGRQDLPADDETEAGLWSALRNQGSIAARERLFSRHYAYARMIAASRYRGRGQVGIEFADMCQLAYTGLLEAIDHFDPERGVSFRSFAARRIHGSILDGIAKMTEVRQQISHRSRMRAERARSLATDGADPLSAADALEALTDMALGLALGFMLEGSRIYMPDEECDDGPDAYESFAWKEAVQRVMAQVADLPELERTILHRHYKEGLTFDQIGALVGVTKSRISQIHRRALALLRSRLADAVDFHLVR